MIMVYEDSAGGITITDGEWFVSGIEGTEHPGQLLNDILSWENWKDDQPGLNQTRGEYTARIREEVKKGGG
jgi:hypothetical protein